MANARQVSSKRKAVVKVQTVTATHAKNSFGEIIRQAYQADQHLIVEKSGIPVVAIVPIADYERMMRQSESGESSDTVRLAASRQEAARRLRSTLAGIHARMPEMHEAEVDRDIAAAVREVRSGRRRRSAQPAPKSRA